MYLAARLGALPVVRVPGAVPVGVGDLGRVLSSWSRQAVGGLGQSSVEDDLARLAREAEMDPAILLKAYRDEQEALRAAPDRAAYIGSRLKKMKDDFARAQKLVEASRTWAKESPTAEAQRNLALAEKRLAIVDYLVKRIEEESGGAGMGNPFLLLIGLASAIAILYFSFSEGKKITGALITAVNVAAIGGAFLGLLYMLKVARDIWAPPPQAR